MLGERAQYNKCWHFSRACRRQGAHDLVAVHVGQKQVGNNTMWSPCDELLKGFQAIFRDSDIIEWLALQALPDCFSHSGMIFNHQNARRVVGTLTHTFLNHSAGGSRPRCSIITTAIRLVKQHLLKDT